MIIYAVDPIKRTTKRWGKRTSVNDGRQSRRGTKVKRTSEQDNRVKDINEVSIDSFVCAARLGAAVRGAAYCVSTRKRGMRVSAYIMTATNSA